jgi:hypothetical protein
MHPVVGFAVAFVVTAAPAIAAPATQTFLDPTGCPAGYQAHLMTREEQDGYTYSVGVTYDQALQMYRERLLKQPPPLEDPVIKCLKAEPVTFVSNN